MTMQSTTVALALALLIAPLAAEAQQAGSLSKLYRVGILTPGQNPYLSPVDALYQACLDAFRQEMHKRGWIEGQNLVLEWRFDEGRPERYPELARELVRLSVDLLVAPQTPGIRALMQATQTIPIVMVAPADPVRDGLVASLARPGGNVTGGTFDLDLGTYLKQVEFLKQIMPNLSSVAVFSNPAARFPVVEELAKAIPQAGLSSLVAGARTVEEIEPAFRRMKQEGAQAAIMVAEGLLIINMARVVELSLKYRLPLGCQYIGLPLAGGLMSYSPDIIENWRRAATFADRILRGAKPADLPVERPSTVNLTINLKAAKGLGLTIPQSVLLRANQVIE